MDGHDRETNLLRHLNLTLVANLLRKHQPISRVDLAERSRLGRSTITGIVGQLTREGLVLEVGEAQSTGGRKPILLELAARSRLVVCVRLSTRAVALGLYDLNGHLVVRHRRAVRGRDDPLEVLGQVATWVAEMLREYGPQSRRVVGGALVLPGRVDAQTGTVIQSTALGWSQVAAGSWLTKRVGCPFLVDSDSYAFVQGEQRHGAATGVQHVLGITVGAEVGAGLILNDRLCRGANAGLGGVGHMLVAPEGPPCSCGRRGCLEAMVGDGALVAQALSAIDRGADTLLLELVEGRRQAITRNVIVAAAQDGDRLAMRLIEQAGHRLGEVVAQLANALSPHLILLGGEAVDQAGPLLMDPIREVAMRRLVPWVAEQLRIEQAVLGESAFLMGAAEQVLDRIFAQPVPGEDPGANPLSLANWLLWEES